MNIDEKMSYKNFVFPVNPSIIRISYKRKVSQQKIPFGNDVVSDMGSDCRKITGEGEFYGKDCIEIFDRLKKVFESDGGGMLYIPSQKPFYAMFSELNMTAEDVEGVVKYNFEFIESFEKNACENVFFCIADGKSDMWDISFRYGKPVEYLMKLNPSVNRPDYIIECGRKVILC